MDKNLLGKKLLGYMFYRHHVRVLWDVILKNHLPDMKGTRMLEVGCAPGTSLVTFNQRLGCVPYGIDYSEQGVETCRRVFTGECKIFCVNGHRPVELMLCYWRRYDQRINCYQS